MFSMGNESSGHTTTDNTNKHEVKLESHWIPKVNVKITTVLMTFCVMQMQRRLLTATAKQFFFPFFKRKAFV